MSLLGPVRVDPTAPAGAASVTVSLVGWPGQSVTATTHPVTVLPRKEPPPAEPVAAEWLATLPHPAPTAGVFRLRVLPDGHLLTAGGDGTVLSWAVADRRERWRLTLPDGFAAGSVVPSPDGRTLYAAVRERVVGSDVRGGTTVARIRFRGAVRSWDAATGVERPPWPSPAGFAASAVAVSPDGRTLAVTELADHDAGMMSTGPLVTLDAATGARRVVAAAVADVRLAPDGRSAAASNDAGVRRLDLATGRTLAAFPAPAERRVYMHAVTQDGTLAVVGYSPDPDGGPVRATLLDAATLAVRGAVSVPGRPGGYPQLAGDFTPDGKRFVLFDSVGNAHV